MGQKMRAFEFLVEGNPDILDYFWGWFNVNSMKEISTARYDHVVELAKSPKKYGITEIKPMSFQKMNELNDKNQFEKLILTLAFKHGWVRVSLGSGVLNIQAKNLRQVSKAARYFSENYEFSELILELDDSHVIDFGYGPSPILRGERLEFFLKKGKIPSKLVKEIRK